MKQKNTNVALEIFRRAALTVPAYRHFLKKHGIVSARITTDADFAGVPSVSKKNYLLSYPYRELFPHGKVPPMISASSGSSGKPFYWPRGNAVEERGAEIHERIFRDIFNIGKKRVLVVVCFSMGTWIAGTYTAACVRRIADKGYPISVVTPGIEKEDILAILSRLAPEFDMVIMAGYPPFLMDIATEAHARHISLEKLNMRLLFAGENFSEHWRESIHRLCGIRDAFRGSIGIYGTADAAILGHETPLSIYLRKRIAKNSSFRKKFLGAASFVPTLVRYYPEYVHIEEVDSQLAFTVEAGTPLVRYTIGDMGRLFSSDAVAKLVPKSLRVFNAPLLALLGRKDVAVTFYALNIYPENIKAGLEDKTTAHAFSGKFVAKTVTTRGDRDQKLLIIAELARGVRPSRARARKAEKSLFINLMRLNAEYRKLYRSIGDRALPQVRLVPFGDATFDITRAKHRWFES